MLVRVNVRDDCVRRAHGTRRKPIRLAGECVLYVLCVDFQASLADQELFFIIVQFIQSIVHIIVMVLKVLDIASKSMATIH